MKKLYTPAFLLVMLAGLAQKVAAQSPVILDVLPKSVTIEQNEKFEASIKLNAAFVNPYNYDEIRVAATFTAPNGEQTTIEGFYMEDFEIVASTGAVGLNNSTSKSSEPSTGWPL